MTPEKKVQNSIIKYFKDLEKKGAPCLIERRQAGGFNYKKGVPDLYAVYKGRHMEIEVKKLGGKLSSMQYKQKEKYESIGIIYICAESLNQVIDTLKLYFPNENF